MKTELKYEFYFHAFYAIEFGHMLCASCSAHFSLLWRINEAGYVAAGFIVFLVFGFFENAFFKPPKMSSNAAYVENPVLYALCVFRPVIHEVGRPYYRVCPRSYDLENGLAMGLGFASLEGMTVTEAYTYEDSCSLCTIWEIRRMENNPSVTFIN